MARLLNNKTSTVIPATREYRILSMSMYVCVIFSM